MTMTIEFNVSPVDVDSSSRPSGKLDESPGFSCSLLLSLKLWKAYFESDEA